MLALIQNIETKAFFSPSGHWTPKSADALLFGSSVDAIDFAMEKQLNKVQLVLKFSNRPEFDVLFPLSECFRRN